MNRLVTFGMNVGYNSCTAGARTIHQTEADEHYNIPWCLTHSLDCDTFATNKEHYHTLIQEGESLGIHTWLLRCPKLPQDLPEFIAAFPRKTS